MHMDLDRLELIAKQAKDANDRWLSDEINDRRAAQLCEPFESEFGPDEALELIAEVRRVRQG
jgi:hypothetical protein